MQNRQTAYLVALLTISLAAVTMFYNATFGDEKPPKMVASEFDGKIVTVYFGDPTSGHGQILTDVSLTEIGGRMVLVGTGAHTPVDDNWTEGVRIGVAWDSVGTYYAMTKEQYDAKIKQHSKY